MTNGDAHTTSDGSGGGGPTKPRDAAAVKATEVLDPTDTRLVADDGNGGGGPTKIRDKALKPGGVERAIDGSGGGGPTVPHKLADDGNGAGGGGPTGGHP